MELIHTVFAFLIILSTIVFIHEFGHYIVARWCGVKIETFSIGFGKEIFGWTDKHQTRWKFSLVPLGGYVKMFGDASEASTADTDKLAQMTPEERAVSFHYKPLPKKAAVVAAGPMFNFLLTIGIFTWMIFHNGLATTEPIVGETIPGTPAAEAGLKTGDRILSMDGKKVKRFHDIPRFLLTNTGKPVALEIEREGENLSLSITPRLVEVDDGLGNKAMQPQIGFKAMEMRVEEYGIFGSVWQAVKRTWYLIDTTIDYLGQMITGERSATELKGPIGIAKLSGQAADQGFSTVIWFMALLSANLGFVNILPIPPLDGGHLVFYAIEGARGRPMAERFQEWGYRAGFALVMMLMAFTVFNDIRQLI